MLSNSKSLMESAHNLGKAPLSERFCAKPFINIEVGRHPENAINVCCPSWLSTPLGLLKDQPQELLEIWNSKKAQLIRQSIHDGSFKYCNHQRCGRIQCGDLPLRSEISDPVLRQYIDQKMTILPDKPRILNLANDRSCNLSCPSCRTEKVLLREGAEFESINRITAFFQSTRHTLILIECFDGVGN